MSRAFLHRQATKLHSFFVRARRNSEGVAAVEFGFIAPIMILMLVGTVEISRAVTIDRRLGLVTSMIADLVTREESISSTTLVGATSSTTDGIYGLVRHIMGPYDNGSMKVSIIPVKAKPTDATVTKVYAATTNRPPLNGGVGASEPALGSDFALTSGLLDAGGQLIVVKTSYHFTPLLIGYVMGSSTWTDKAIMSPRNSSGCVDFDNNNCIPSPTIFP